MSQTYFTPPTIIERFAWKGSLTLKQNTGVTVLKTGTSYTQAQSPTDEQIAAADIVYPGGRSYPVGAGEAAALTAAGYGAYLTVL